MQGGGPFPGINPCQRGGFALKEARLQACALPGAGLSELSLDANPFFNLLVQRVYASICNQKDCMSLSPANRRNERRCATALHAYGSECENGFNGQRVGHEMAFQYRICRAGVGVITNTGDPTTMMRCDATRPVPK